MEEKRNDINDTILLNWVKYRIRNDEERETNP